AYPGERQQRAKPADRMAQRAVRQPTEPADDTTMAIDHRLQLARSRLRFGLEPQILEAGDAFDVAELARLDRGKVDAGVANVSDGAEQRGTALQVLSLIGLSYHGDAGDGADQRGTQHDDAKQRHRTCGRWPARRSRSIGKFETHDHARPATPW